MPTMLIPTVCFKFNLQIYFTVFAYINAVHYITIETIEACLQY